MLWGRAANRCAFPGCECELVIDETETDDASLIGEMCHIVARQKDGPRGDSSLTPDQRDKYDNLVLMCNIHHKLIDDQPNNYTVEKLKKYKKAHEKNVREKLQSGDSKKQIDDELYSGYIDKFEKLAGISYWNEWTSWLFSRGQPQLYNARRSELDELRTWLLNRIWPNRYDAVEKAFENFRLILGDLLNTFDEYSEPFGPDSYITEKFYRRVGHENQQLRRKFVDAYEDHCWLVEDLALELTRAANFLFDRVREHVSKTYRLEEGMLIVTAGMFEDNTYKDYKVQYKNDERVLIPYPGLEEFKNKVRFKRDLFFGRQVVDSLSSKNIS